MMKVLLLSGVAWYMIPCGTYAQTAINIKAGLLNLQFADEDIGKHYGLSIGFDIIVEDSRLLFLPGMHYQQFEIRQTTSRGRLFAERTNFHQISLPLSIGTQIVRDPIFTLRAYAGGHLNFTVGIDENLFGINTENVHEVHPGIQGGLQFMLWHVTLDVRYVYDFNKTIKARDDSKLHGWEVLIGAAF